MLINHHHPRAKTRFWVHHLATIVHRESPSKLAGLSFVSFDHLPFDSKQLRYSCRFRGPLNPLCSHRHGAAEMRTYDAFERRNALSSSLLIYIYGDFYYGTFTDETSRNAIPTNSGAIFTTNLSFLTATKYS